MRGSVMHRNALLASDRRRNLFARVTNDVGTVIAFEPANKTYLTGYHSMTHDLAHGYRSAAIATRNGVCLVASAADAGPALEVMGDPKTIFRYGSFYFGDIDKELGFAEPGFETFFSALAAALAFAGSEGRIGVDDATLAGSIDGDTVDLALAFRASRAFKLPAEIELLRRGTLITEAAIAAVGAQARVGMSEFDLAAIVANSLISDGGIPRFISMTSGERSALADAYPTTRRLEPGDLLRLDIGCMVDGYWSDIGRTMVMGQPSALQQKRHDAIVAGLKQELGLLRAGVAVSDIFNAGVLGVRSNGIDDYQRHHCGHGIGLAGYEYPLIAADSNAVLEQNMSLCLETPFYEIGWGGMMVEDTVILTEHGFDSLSTLGHDLTIIEA